MAEFQIPISYVVSASAVTPGAGIEPLKLGTILVLTTSEPIASDAPSYIISRTASGISTAYGTETTVSKLAQIIFSQNPNILANDGYLIVASFNENETYSQAITRLSNQIYFEGVITDKDLEDEEAGEASATVQSMKNRVLFLPSSDVNALQSGNGLFYKLKNNPNTKCLLYTLGENEAAQKLNSKLFAAAYASRGLAVNYNGSNTTMTMNLKDLTGIQADTNISETILQQCVELGVDCFPSIDGLAKVISNKTTLYFDQIVNQIWFISSIQRAVFNVLATTRTKIAQTDIDLEKITKAIRGVCKQGITNGMLAPGTWNSPDTFGNLEDFHRNIEEFGFYIYHQPVSEQAQINREERKAPLYQIAAKEAGAVHSGNILIYIEP